MGTSRRPIRCSGGAPLGSERAHRDVGLALRQIEVPGVGVELELDAGMLLAQVGQDAQQDLRDERVGAGHAHGSLEPRVLPGETALQGGHLTLDALRPGDHLVARVRQQVAVAVPVEQLHAEPRLEGLDPPRHGRVAHAEHRACRAHRARASQREKVAHVIPIHGCASIPHSTRPCLCTGDHR